MEALHARLGRLADPGGPARGASPAHGPGAGARARLWPFETAWDAAVDDDSIVIAELWPSLVDCRAQPYPIKDATARSPRSATGRWTRPSALARSLARPADLTHEEERTAREREGWIAGHV